MKLLVYLGHPAHFHLFKQTVKVLQEKNHEVKVVIKSKDVLEKLVQEAGVEYVNIVTGPRKNGKFSMAKNFVRRLRQLSGIIKKFSPDLLMGSAAELALLGKLHHIPSYIFFEDDFEIAPSFA